MRGFYYHTTIEPPSYDNTTRRLKKTKTISAGVQQVDGSGTASGGGSGSAGSLANVHCAA